MKARLMAKITAPLFALALCLGLSTPPSAHAQDATLGEIKTFAFNFCPNITAAANGQKLTVVHNSALFTLLGTSFGGNGTTNFDLPNLAGRAMIGKTDTTKLGDKAGASLTTLDLSHIPLGLGPRAAARDGGATPGTGLVALGASAAVVTMPPYLAMTQCITTNGVFPTMY
jgi:microcystin-dependent protein